MRSPLRGATAADAAAQSATAEPETATSPSQDG